MKRLRQYLLAGALAALVSGCPAAFGTNPGANGRIVFIGLEGWVYSINPDGTGLKRLGPSFASNSHGPNWSPDGSRIVFFHSSTDADKRGAYLMQADGSGTHRISPGGAGPWSPDGTKIVFSGSGVSLMDADGGNVTQLAGSDSTMPTWSPNGTRIAFIRGTPDGHSQMWTMAPTGGNQTLIHDDTAPLWSPDWAPDGSTIIFWRGNGVTVANQIWSMQPDGSDLKQLTTVGENIYGAWSPDGTKITFGSSRGGVWLMNPDGSGQVRIKGKIDFSEPAWQPLSVTLRAARTEVTYGDAVTLTAHLVPHVISPNQAVAIYALPQGGSKTLVSSGTVNAQGNYSVPVHPIRHTKYMAEWSGDSGHLGGGIAETKVKVHALVTGTLRKFDGRSGRFHLYDFSPRCPRTGNQCPLYRVHVAPNHAGERVELKLEVHVGGRWQEALSFRRRLDDRSSYAVRYVYGDASVIGLSTRTRARFLGDKDHLQKNSVWSYFKVI